MPFEVLPPQMVPADIDANVVLKLMPERRDIRAHALKEGKRLTQDILSKIAQSYKIKVPRAFKVNCYTLSRLILQKAFPGMSAEELRSHLSVLFKTGDDLLGAHVVDDVLISVSDNCHDDAFDDLVAKVKGKVLASKGPKESEPIKTRGPTVHHTPPELRKLIPGEGLIPGCFICERPDPENRYIGYHAHTPTLYDFMFSQPGQSAVAMCCACFVVRL